jgi:DNA-binding response OmpR family regulator
MSFDEPVCSSARAGFTNHSQPSMNTLLKVTPQEMAEMFDLEQPSSRRRIMVVDDDPDIRHLMSEVLAGSGYSVDVAENGTRAWKALHLKQYDLLLTDHEMPGMTGMQLVNKLRLAGFQFPVIVASGSPPVDLTVRNSVLASVIMLPKPFTLGELIRLIKELLPESASSSAACLAETFPESWQLTNPRF